MRNFLLAPARRLETELLIAVAAIALWQAIRPLLEGSSEHALANAYDWVALETLLRLDIEPALIGAVSEEPAHGVLRWLYGNMHVPALFAFLAAARLAAPSRYPLLRAAFLLSYVPALAVIGLYPLAPPDWLPQLGIGSPPSDAELTSGWEAFENSTAAAASQHFGFAAFVAFGSLWIARESWVARLAVLYPAAVFIVIVGLGEHYVLDCVLGFFTFLLAGAAALALDRAPRMGEVDSVGRGAVALAAVSAGLAAWGAESSIRGAGGGRLVAALAFVLGVMAVVVVSRAVLAKPQRRGAATASPSPSIIVAGGFRPSPSAFAHEHRASSTHDGVRRRLTDGTADGRHDCVTSSATSPSTVDGRT